MRDSVLTMYYILKTIIMNMAIESHIAKTDLGRLRKWQ